MKKQNEIIETIDKKAFLFGSIFISANKLQLLGDSFDDRITLKQWNVLAAVSFFKEGASIGDVAEFTSTSGQNVKKIAVILEKKGYITIIKDSKDARYVRLHITDLAMELFEDRRQREEEFMEQLFQDMDHEVIDNFYAAMRMFINNMGALEEKILDKK